MLEDAKAGNRHAIDKIQNAPEVDDRFRFYWLAYQELRDERQSQGMSVGPIPPSKIKRFCEEEELDPLESEALFNVVRAVDRHANELDMKKAQEERAKAERAASKRR